MPTPEAQALFSQLQTAADKLKADPKNIPLRTEMLKNQVLLTAGQLGVTTKQAGDAVRNYTALYAQNKGIDPKAVMDALSVEEQKILNYSSNNPTLYGMDLITANKMAGYAGAASGIALGAALGLFTIAMFTAGPEAAAAIADGEGVVAVLGSVLGNKLIAFAGFTFLISQMLGHLATNIPMITKQMIDNGSIGPGLRVTALKDILTLQQKASGTSAPGPYTAAEFTGIAKGIEAGGVTGINSPTKNQSIPYTRNDLAQLVIYVYGQQILKGLPITPTKITPLLQPYLIFAGKSTPTTAPIVAAAPRATTTQSVKVFTGVVSQGTLGAPVTFVARENDLIESTDELKQAAQQNLAPYIASLPGRIAYEIKIVSSVLTKDGFRQHGSVQRVQTGTYANGQPKYKTVTNKFAVLTLYLVQQGGKRLTLDTITLGPTDAIKLQPTQTDLSSLEGSLQSNLVTTDINQITGIQTSQPITIGAPVAVALGPQNTTGAPPTSSAPGELEAMSTQQLMARYGVTLYKSGTEVALYEAGSRQFVSGIRGITDPQNLLQADGIDPASLPPLPSVDEGDKLGLNLHTLKSPGISAAGLRDFLLTYVQNEHADDPNYKPGAATTAAPTPSAAGPLASNAAGQTPQAAPPGACSATTLSAYYTALGKSLPTVAERSKLYADLGLGLAAYYTGTAEQNTKLLAATKKQIGCPI